MAHGHWVAFHSPMYDKHKQHLQGDAFKDLWWFFLQNTGNWIGPIWQVFFNWIGTTKEYSMFRRHDSLKLLFGGSSNRCSCLEKEAILVMIFRSQSPQQPFAPRGPCRWWYSDHSLAYWWQWRFGSWSNHWFIVHWSHSRLRVPPSSTGRVVWKRAMHRNSVFRTKGSLGQGWKLVRCL